MFKPLSQAIWTFRKFLKLIISMKNYNFNNKLNNHNNSSNLNKWYHNRTCKISNPRVNLNNSNQLQGSSIKCQAFHLKEFLSNLDKLNKFPNINNWIHNKINKILLSFLLLIYKLHQINNKSHLIRFMHHNQATFRHHINHNNQIHKYNHKTNYLMFHKIRE